MVERIPDGTGLVDLRSEPTSCLSHSATIPCAESFHPSEIIQDEMNHRGWDKFDLAIRMGGDPHRNILALDIYFIVGPTRTNCRIGQTMAYQLAVAFDVSHQYFLNLETAWLAAQRIEARSDETPQAVQPEGQEPDPEGAPNTSLRNRND